MASAGVKLLRAAEAGDAKAVEALLKGGAPVWAADEARARTGNLALSSARLRCGRSALVARA